MKLNFIRLRDFRNVEFAEIGFGGACAWINGANAQGKTNLLEAVAFVGTLRSFRTSSPEVMLRRGAKSAGILAQVEIGAGVSDIELSFGAEKSTLVDGENVAKISDYFGRFPTLAITNEDVKLLRGAPEIRRRDVDMFVSSIDSGYFDVLRRYHRALLQRNKLLKEDSPDPALFDAFENEMALSAFEVLQTRKERLGELGEIASEKYRAIAGETAESATLNLKPSYDADSVDGFRELFRACREADFERRFTQKGVHRDDYRIFIDDKDAKLYASEGQQKSAAIAIRLAQFELAKKRLRTEPLMLCDDILGELDAARRGAFWQCVSPTAQVIATSTDSPPESDIDWRFISVSNGVFTNA